MSAVINKNESSPGLNTCEAKAFFENEVKARLGVTTEEFFNNLEKYKNSPHFESLMFLSPLAKDASK